MTPTLLQFNEGMQTAHDTKATATEEKLPVMVKNNEPRRRIRRKKGHTRFTPLTRKMRTPVESKKVIPMTLGSASIVSMPLNIPQYDLHMPSSAAPKETPVLPFDASIQ